jgi:hypothetical protein
VRERGFDMGILLVLIYQGREQREKGVYAGDRQPAGGQRRGRPTKRSGGNRNDACDAGGEPYDTDASQAWFRRNTDQWKGEIIQWRCGVRHRDGVSW